MNIIIPIGGIGSRFKTQGYKLPKPLININGIPMIQYVLDSLRPLKEDRIVIIYNKELQNYGFEELVKSIVKVNLTLIALNECTSGAVHTVYKYLKDDNRDTNKTVIFDCDTFYECDILSKIRDIKYNGLVCFEYFKEEPIFSFVTLDEDMMVQMIREKAKISNYANTGCYIFANAQELKHYCKHILESDFKFSNEHYLSCVIDKMLEDGEKFQAIVIGEQDFKCVGTPEQLKTYCASSSRIKTLRVCFDIDDTLFHCPNKDYANPIPIQKNILMLKALKKSGHTIILHTARRMKSSDNCVGKSVKDIGFITLQTLQDHDIPYDEIYFGKPFADFYIDDRAIYSNSDLEKEIGFYVNTVSERSFNNIHTESMDVVVKRGKISAEIYYYQNIPRRISHLFPVFISHDHNSYTLEKISGINLSHCMVKGELNKTLLSDLITTIQLIHAIKPEGFDVSLIYDHYEKRLKDRFNKIHPSYLVIIESLERFFSNYRENNKAIPGMILGDPVFTNILIKDKNFKFIDMRGQLCDEFTIYGDVMYDFAKIYQSLLGYDEIMHGVFIENTESNSLRKLLCEFIKNTYGEYYVYAMKMICISHIYTLLPLHNIKMSEKYARLIDLDVLMNDQISK